MVWRQVHHNHTFYVERKNKYHVMYDGAEVDQFIMVMPEKYVLFDKSRNELYYHDMEDCD